MTRYRDRLPQLDGGLFLTDGGIETDLIFNGGFDLPCFAAFDLFKNEDGDPVELGSQYCAIRLRFGNFNVLGGCCGTDHRHVAAIYRACQDAA